MQNKSIEMNLLVHKGGSNQASKAGSEQEGKKLTKCKTAAITSGTKGNKNLQFAMDINREMEMMLAENDIDIKPKKGKKKK